MVKKTYVSPASLTVQLGTCKMMAESLPVGGGEGGGDNTINDPSQILTKENKDVNLWDEEW